jgi:hypothetical protein
MQRTPWLERQFSFDFPVTHFPFIVVRLTGTAARIDEMVRGMNNEQLCRREDGKWSLKEHIGHLLDLEELHKGRIDDFIHKKEQLRAADMSNQKTNTANHNQTEIEKLLLNFRKGREQFISQLEAAGDEVLSQSAFHPRLQKQMRLVDMAFFVCEHDDHHLSMMREMIRENN